MKDRLRNNCPWKSCSEPTLRFLFKYKESGHHYLLIKVTFCNDLKAPIKHMWWRLFNTRLRTRSILQNLFTDNEIQKKQFHSSSQNLMGT